MHTTVVFSYSFIKKKLIIIENYESNFIYKFAAN